MKSIIEIQDELKKVLKKKRWHHTLGVQYTAQALAMAHGIDMEKAGYGGVLHDCAKNLDDKTMIKECEIHDIVISPVERKQPSLLHAKLGACYAHEIYGVKDPEILDAIRWHTTGKPQMTSLEKIVFIADYMEPNRKKLPEMDRIRQVAFQDLDEAMYLILKSTITYLENGDKNHENPMDSHTIEAYTYYKKKSMEEKK